MREAVFERNQKHVNILLKHCYAWFCLQGFCGVGKENRKELHHLVPTFIHGNEVFVLVCKGAIVVCCFSF